MSKKSPPVDPASPFAALKSLRDKLADEESARANPASSAPKAPLPTAKARPHRKDHEPHPASAEDQARASEEEALAFHRMVNGVTPLGEGPGRISPARAAMPARPRVDTAGEEANEVHEHLRALVEGGSRFETSDDGRHIEGKRVDVPPDWLRKLRRGQLPIDARLDLHGLGATQARDALASFLKDKRARGERCVLVVHGKGEHSPNGVGVLRGEVGAWLAQGSASLHVAAFATAQAHDGGEGALYVLLRR